MNPPSKLYIRLLSSSKNQELSVTWIGDPMICTCQHYISKGRLWPFLKVKDPALQIATGNKKSLGSCSYVRINLSIHLKSKQYGLTTLTILENRFGLPENQNIPQSNLFILKVICQLSVMIFIFLLNNFFYALSFKSHFLFQRSWLGSFFCEGKIHVHILNDRLRTTLFVIHCHHQ